MYIAPKNGRYLERVLWLIAGLFVLLGIALAYYVSPWWLILPVLVGVNLVIFALTGFCLMANVLIRLGVKSGLSK